MKSGFLTTEFWLSLGGFVAGLALIVIGATQHDKELLQTGVVLMITGSVPYAGVRAFVKSKSITGLGAETQGRANEVLARMLDFAEQYVEKLAKLPEPTSVAPICPQYVPIAGNPDDGPCAVCGAPRFGHAGIAQALAPFTAIDLSEATQHLTDEDFEELIKAAKFDRSMRNTPPVPDQVAKP